MSAAASNGATVTIRLTKKERRVFPQKCLCELLRSLPSLIEHKIEQSRNEFVWKRNTFTQFKFNALYQVALQPHKLGQNSLALMIRYAKEI